MPRSTLDPLLLSITSPLLSSRRGFTPPLASPPSPFVIRHSPQHSSPFFSHSCALFCTFLHSRKTQLFYFQALPHSLRKTPGGWGRVIMLTSHPSSPRTLCLSVKLSDPFRLTAFVSAPYALFSLLLHTTAPASLFLSSSYKLFAVTTGVGGHGFSFPTRFAQRSAPC